MKTAVAGYPRIGTLRELKFALEKYFRKETEAVQLSDGSAEQTGQTAAPSGEASTTAGSVAEVAESAMPEVVAITSVSIQEIPYYFGFGFSSRSTQQYSRDRKSVV